MTVTRTYFYKFQNYDLLNKNPENITRNITITLLLSSQSKSCPIGEGTFIVIPFDSPYRFMCFEGMATKMKPPFNSNVFNPDIAEIS